MKHIKNRILSLVLTFCMMLSLLPVGLVTAGAAGAHVVTQKPYQLTSSQPLNTNCGDTFSATLTADTGKTLSDYITVTLGGNMLGSENYTYTRNIGNTVGELKVFGLTGSEELIIETRASNHSNDWYTSWELAAELARHMKYTPATSTISWDSIASLERKYANDDVGSNAARLCGFTIVAYQGLDPENIYFAKMGQVPLATTSITTRQLFDTKNGTANWNNYNPNNPLKLQITIERYEGDTIWGGSVSSYFFEFKDVPNPSTVKNLTVTCTNAKIASSTTHTQQVSSTVDIQPVTVTADSGYALPDTITGTLNGLVYTKTNATTATISGKMTADTNLTVTAVQDKKTVTITLGNHMTLVKGLLEQSVTPGSPIANITVKADTGYTLPADYTDSTTGLSFTQGTGTISGAKESVTILAATANTFTVKYNANNGTGNMTDSNHTYGVASTLTANTFTRTGYTFNGWKTEVAGGTSYADKANATTLTTENNATVNLYAQWKVDSYTITFNGHGNTGGSTAAQTYTFEETKSLTANGFTKTGYTFDKWTTNEGGSGTVYTDAQSTSFTGNTTLYAQWTPNTYTVKFEAGTGGTGDAMVNQARTYDDNTPLLENSYAKAHYQFTGWKDGNNNVVAAGSTDNLTSEAGATVTLTAQWTAEKYTINIKAGTGMTLSGNAANQNITYPGAIETITVTAAAGYVLPATWTAAELNGLVYARKTLTTAEITGNPTAVVDATVPNAVKMVPEVDTNGKGLITVTTDPGKEYKITSNTGVDAFDKNGDKLTPKDPGGWVNTNNGPITFKPLKPGVEYIVTTRTKDSEDIGIGEVIPVPAIGGNVYVEPDVTNPETNVQIVISPADAGLKYAVLTVPGGVQAFPKDPNTWVTPTGTPLAVTVPGLDPNTQYEIVAVKNTDNTTLPTGEKGKGTTITTPTVDIGTGVTVNTVDRLPGTAEGDNKKDKIVIKPTDARKDYGITDPDTGVTKWKTGTGSEMTFDKLDPTKKYEVSIRENNKPSGDPSVPSVGVTVDVNIPTTNITGGYDDKGTPGTEDDKATITVKPANPDLDYGIVDEHGAPVAAPNDIWKPGATDGVKFEGLTPGTNYKVVTRPKSENAKPAVNEIPGGTGIVTPVPPVDPGTVTREVDTDNTGKDKITINPTVDTQTYTVTDLTTGEITTKDGTGSALVFDNLDPTHKYQVTTAKKDDKGTTKLPSVPAVVDVRGKVTLTGVVKDGSGAVAPNAIVKVAVKTIGGGSRVLTAVTDASGSYTFTETDVENGSYDIYVDGGEKGSVIKTAVVNGGTLDSGDLTLDVAKETITGGVVTTVDGKPVKDAVVTVINKSTGLEVPPPAGSVTTTKDGGGYVIEDLEDGTYIIQTTDGTKSGMTEIVVKGGKILPNIEGGFKNTNISTVPGGIVTGKITVLGVGEKTKVTITVPIVDEHDKVIGTKNVTAQAVGGVGHYQFAGVPDGEYPVTVVGPDGRLIVDKITITGGVVTGGDIAIPDTKPEKPNVVTGIVMDKNGKPVPGATVKIYDKTGALVTTDPATVTTGKGGGWAVKGLDPEKGPFTVTVDKNGTNGVAGPVTVDVSGKVTGKTNVELPGTVDTSTGAVTPDVAGKLLTGKVTDSAGNPAEGATVVVKDSAGNVIAKTTTNKDGIYFVPNVPTGATVTVITKTGENGKPGSLGSGDTLNGNTTTAKPGSQLLTVIGPKGDVLPVRKGEESDTVAHIAVVGVAPTVNPDDANVKITGDKLDVSELPDGTYRVTVTQNGMTLTKDIEVKNHAIVGDNTMAATSKTVEGKLDYGSGTIPSDATVTIKGGSSADYIWGSAMVNPKDGSYKITGIPEGSYTVELAVKNPDDADKNTTITNTVTVTKDGTVTFGSDWTADKGADITTGTGGKLTVTPSTAVTTVTDAITTALTKTNPAATASDVKTVIDTVKALTEEEQKQIKTDEVKKLSDKLQELLKASLSVAADANGVTAATKEATKGVLNDQKGLLVTGDEVTAAASKTVKVGLTLDAENVTSNPPADKNKAEAAAKGGDIGAFFDISVTKITEVTSSDGAKSTATEKVPVLPVAVPVTLAIPAEIQGHAYYNVIRVHNGVAERIPATATQTTVSFLSSLYSTYAIAYSDDPIFPDDKPAVDEDKNGGNTGGGATVQPVTGGSVTTSPRNPKPGDKVTITVNPDKGYKVDTVKVQDKNGKEVDVTKNGDGTYTYIQPEGKVRIDVKFKKAGTQVGPFTDVTNDQWFAEAVEFVYKEKLFNGVAPDKFGPQITTTRGMFVTVLGRLAKVDVTQWTAKSKFPDIVSSAYYAPYVAWGEAQGIVLGFDDGNYRPDAMVTREQMAAILYRYVQKNGGGYKGDWAYLLPYADKGNISDYALEAISWCNQNSIINGKGGNRLDPTGNATRAEVAAVIQRFAGLTK